MTPAELTARARATAKTAHLIRIEGGIAYVPLTQGYEAVIDAEDVPLVSESRWRAHKNYRTVYATSDIQKSDGKQTTVRMHTILTGFSICDHVDGDGLNNRRGNLREVTTAQNQHNQRLRRDNTSGFKGVTWLKRERRWVSRIKVNGHTHRLGYYSSPEDAHAAYCEASARLHGQFGRAK